MNPRPESHDRPATLPHPTVNVLPLSCWRPARWPVAALLATALVACADLRPAKPHVAVWQSETFQADERFSRLFDSANKEVCEAARRALLSQGYVISQADASLVKGVKRFQPENEVNVEIAFNVVCLPDGRDGQLATAYVSAQQERFVVKKNSSSTSLGVSALGSISIPTSSTQDSLVKVAAETIASTEFYDRFFNLMLKNLAELKASADNSSAP